MATETRSETGAATSPATPTSAVELVIGGMTCASCAARIEKKLNKLDGVVATVNYATEKAKVTFPSTLTQADLTPVVEATGYTAIPPAPAAAATGSPPDTVDGAA